MNTINNTYKRIITRVLSGEATATEKKKLDLWLARSKAHSRLYEQYKRIWELEPETHPDTEFDTQQALNKVLKKIATDNTIKHSHNPIQSRHRFFINKTKKLYWISGVAAAFLILITTSLFFFLRNPQAEMLALAAGQQDELFALDDGSRVHLRAGASLFYPKGLNYSKRNVRLAGSAYFEVEKDDQRPFVITTDHAIIEVLGTSFYVDESEDYLMVYVSEGMVRLKSLCQYGTEATIPKGESGKLHYEYQKITKRKFDNMNFLAWKTGTLEFNNEILSEVFEVLEEVYAIRIKAPESVMNMKLTARFQEETPEDVLKSISLVFGFDVTTSKNEYAIQFANTE